MMIKQRCYSPKIFRCHFLQPSNKTGTSRLGFALLLKYFQKEARFPSKKQDIPKVMVEFIAHQLELSPMLFEEYRWGAEERNFTYHRKQIREFFGFRELTAKDNELLTEWLNEQVQFTHDTDYLKNQAYSLFRKWKIEPPSSGSLKRMIDSVISSSSFQFRFIAMVINITAKDKENEVFCIVNSPASKRKRNMSLL